LVEKPAGKIAKLHLMPYNFVIFATTKMMFANFTVCIIVKNHTMAVVFA
jgi:hypothetical protein